ncbi:MAG: hypothetical protein K0R18_204 [Bacillales bacterium]|nr:hypothetical protein [Bacillales bacterium]
MNQKKLIDFFDGFEVMLNMYRECKVKHHPQLNLHQVSFPEGLLIEFFTYESQNEVDIKFNFIRNASLFKYDVFLVSILNSHYRRPKVSGIDFEFRNILLSDIDDFVSQHVTKLVS